MNILVITYHFPPNSSVGSSRFFYLTGYFKKMGHEVNVLTIKERCIQTFDHTLKADIPVHRASMYPSVSYRKFKLLKKLFLRVWVQLAPFDAFSGWIMPAFLKGRSVIKKKHIDKIIVSGPPFSPFVVGYYLSKVCRKDLILDLRDPWSFYLKCGWINKKLNLLFEKLTFRWAATVILNTKKSYDAYKQRYPDHADKMHFIPNGTEKKEISTLLFLNKRKTVILHAGNLYGQRRLNSLLEPLIKLFNEGRFQQKGIEIHVFGVIPETDWNAYEQANMRHLLIEHNYIDKKKTMQYIKGADILYLPQGDDVRYSIPYKFYDYLSSGKPILAITSRDSAVENAIRETACGEYAYINDSDSVYTALSRLLNKFDGYKMPEDFYWNNLSRKFMNII